MARLDKLYPENQLQAGQFSRQNFLLQLQKILEISTMPLH